MLGLLLSCTEEAPTAEPVAPAPAPAAHAAPVLPEDVGPSPTLAGYDLAGPATCLPLPAGRRCVDRRDPLSDACAKAGGQLQRCVDCSTLCSVALTRLP